MNNNINIAVISDLHIGNAARCRKLSPEPTDNQTNEDFLAKFLSFLDDKQIESDYLLVGGDVTNRANPREFRLSDTVIKEIAQKLKVKKRNIFYVPGNHDHNWDLAVACENLDLDEKSITKARHLPLFENGLIFSEIQDNARIGKYDEHPYAVRWEDDNICVVGLNSSVKDSPHDKPHHGSIENSQIEKMKEVLSNIPNEKVKIFLVHHHPIQYQDKTHEIPDLSVMTNSEGLIDLIQEFKFDFVIHGHKHIPHFSQRVSSGLHLLNFLCAGSFSSFLDSNYFGGVGNFFHIINIDKDKRGVLTNWIYFTAHGWTKCDSEREGMFHEECFGTVINELELKDLLKSEFKKRFKDSSIIKWNDVVKSNNSLAYVSKKLLKSILKSLEKELKFSVHRADMKPESNLIIVKD